MQTLRCCSLLAFLAAAVPSAAGQAARAADVLVEAESFAELGGWVVDQQFMDIMGSPYLLAHGLGKPVAPARTEVAFPEAGAWHLWVRTKDWVPSHHPGTFKVLVDGVPAASSATRARAGSGRTAARSRSRATRSRLNWSI